MRVIQAVLALCGLISVSAVAQEADRVSPPDLATVSAAIKARLPNTPIASVKPAPIDGLFEVIMGRNVVYMPASGRYMIAGHIYDMETQKDLTADRVDAVARIDWGKLPLDKAIKIVRGDGSRSIAVFSDPDCPYCRKLEVELDRLPNTTTYLFLLPLAALHPDAPTKAQSIWCAKDRAAAWRDMMSTGKDPVKATCAAPLAEIDSLAKSLGVRGTPYLVAMDGRALPGMAQAPQIDAWLAGRDIRR